MSVVLGVFALMDTCPMTQGVLILMNVLPVEAEFASKCVQAAMSVLAFVDTRLMILVEHVKVNVSLEFITKFINNMPCLVKEVCCF